MENLEERNNANDCNQLPGDGGIVQMLTDLLEMDDPPVWQDKLREDPCLQSLCRKLTALRAYSKMLKEGAAPEKQSEGEGYVLENLAVANENLNRLLYVIESVTYGNYSVRLDLEGELYQAFNHMLDRIQGDGIHEMAYTDALTKIPNRRALDEFLLSLFSSGRWDSARVCGLVVDVDNFKQINSVYGRDMGDHILSILCRGVKGQLKSADYLARFGGAEFFIVFQDGGLESAGKAAQKILNVVRQTRLPLKSEAELQVTVSIGGSGAQKSDYSHAELLKRCDLALAKAKNNGRDRVVLL